MDFLGTSDPYVKLSLTEDRLPAKKTTIKMKSLNPEWNEKFKLIVKDPHSQGLELQVYDWDKVFPSLFSLILNNEIVILEIRFFFFLLFPRIFTCEASLV